MNRQRLWLVSTGIGVTLLLSIGVSGCKSAMKWEDGQRPSARSSGWGAAPQRSAPGTYTVKSGDTLYSIAFRYRLDYKDVARWNGIGRSYLIRPGQTLRLTAPPTTTASTRTSQPPRRGSSSRPATGSPGRAPSNAPSNVPGRPSTPPVRTSPRHSTPAGAIVWAWPTSSPIQLQYTAVRQGVVFSGAVGNAVKAVADGTVVYSGSALKGYGKLVIVKHSEEYLSAYGYNRKVTVNEGDTIKRGQRIAEMGIGPASGRGALRFEIRRNGEPVDPTGVLPRR